MNPLLDVEQITQNMRRSGAGWMAVLAKRHKPYGWGTCRASTHVLHDVVAVRVNYRTPEKFDLLGVWRCGSSSPHPVLVSRARKGDRRCERCLKARPR